MTALKVEIVAFADTAQPGWVKCRLVDADGRTHEFLEKAPIVSDEDLDSQSGYPRPGFIKCTIRARRPGTDGRQLLTVDTETPDGGETQDGESRFEVVSDQVVGRDAG